MEEMRLTLDKFENICRTCLAENNLGSIFDKINNLSIVEMLMAVAKVNVENTDGMPNKMCHSCIKTLDMEFSFKQHTETIDSKLREILNKYSSKNNENGVKCKISSYNYVNESGDVNNENAMKNKNISEISNIGSENLAIEKLQLDDVTNKKSYYCEICSKTFCSNIILKKHLRVHTKQYQYKCELCAKCFRQSRGLLNHKKTHQVVQQTFLTCKKISADSETLDHSCTDFSKTCDFDNKKCDYYVDNTTAKQNTRTVCNICNKKIQSNRFKLHLQTHLGKKPFTCETCNQTFSLKGNYTRHLKIHTNDRPHKCKTCNKSFIHNFALKEHMRAHTHERPYPCQFCEKTFKQSTQRSKHQHLKHKIEMAQEHQCHICQKSFSTSQGLNAHARTHSFKMYDCPECNKHFVTQLQLDNHIKRNKCHISTSKRIKSLTRPPYLCNFCAKKFPLKSSLSDHLRVHTQERPYACSLCTKSFKTRSALNTHKYQHTDERPYRCDQCNSTFHQKPHLVVHQRIHTGEKPYKCTICNKAFAVKVNLIVHARTHSGETPYVCSVCDKGFCDSRSLKKHYSKNHNTDT